MLITEKITTGWSNVQAQLTSLEEREEPEKQHQLELQFHQDNLTQHQHLDTKQDEMRQQHVNQEHSQPKQQQYRIQKQLSVRNYYSSFISKYNINSCKSCKSYNSESLAIISHNHFEIADTASNKKLNIVIIGDSIPKG